MTLDSAFAPPDDRRGAVVPDAPAASARTTRWGRVAVLAAILLVSGGVRMVLTPLQEAAQHDIGFTDLQIATLQGGSNGLGVLCAIPLGLAIDHLNRARLLLALALLWTAGAVMTVYAHGFTTLFIARMLVALGVGGAFAVAISMIADLCTPAQRGRATMIAGIGVLGGPALAFAGGGALFGHFRDHGWALFPGLAPWRMAAMAFAGFGAALLVPVALFPEPPRYETVPGDRSVRRALRGLATRWRFLSALWLGSAAGGLAEGAAGMWAAPILTRNYGLQPNEFGAWMGGMIFVAGLVGSLLGGFAVDGGQRSGRRGGLMIGAIVATVIAIPATAYPVMPTVAGFGWMLGIMMCACTVTQVTAIAAVTLVVPNEERGICIQITGMVGTVIGMGFVPLITLIGPALFGDDRHLAPTLVVVGVATGALALVGYIVAMLVAPRSWAHA